MQKDTQQKTTVFLLLIAASGILGLVFWGLRNEPEPEPEQKPEAIPIVRVSTDGGHVGSASCKECHESQHASWHRSYHRTMTQHATPATVLAPFDGEELDFAGQTYRLAREGDRFFVSTGNPNSPAAPIGESFDSERREIVMTTGSHHIQVYWILEPSSRQLIELPFYFHLAEKRWMLRDETMLRPPGHPQIPSRWNDRCIKCHSVNGVPGWDEAQQRLDTQVAELGIACEACHGPGQEHIAFQKEHAGKGDVAEPDSLIVNPLRLKAKAATQVCGRCHSASKPLDPVDYLKTGLAFRPGDDLHEFVTLNAFDPDGRRTKDPIGTFVEDYSIDGYWKDGTCRVAGDEYNSLIESPCYQGGEFSCLSCHSLHKSDPNDQLAEHAQDNRACTQCHREPRFNAEITEHTHHPANSAGSQCYNCHMPYVSYALLKGIRNHRVTSPSAADSVRFAKPNACNLCHLDQTLDWTASRLSDWYQLETPPLSDDQKAIAASLLWVHKGDAALRVVVAWHMGWAPALEASGADWQAGFLSSLLDDRYAAIRFVAAQSLKRLPGFEKFSFDHAARPEQRQAAAQRALEQWKAQAADRVNLENPDTILINEKGDLRTAEIERLLRQRDNRPVSIAE